MTDFEKFHENYKRVVVDEKSEMFVCYEDEFFHTFYFHIVYAETHADLEHTVDLFADLREELKVSDPDGYVRASIKFENEFHEYAVERGIVEPDTPFVSIDDGFDNLITLKSWRLDYDDVATEQEEAA